MRRRFEDRDGSGIHMQRVEMWPTFEGYMEMSASGIPLANARGIALLKERIGEGRAFVLFRTEGIAMPAGGTGEPPPPRLGHETWLARLTAPVRGRNRTVVVADVEKSALVAGWFQQSNEEPFAVLGELLKTVSWGEHAEDISYEF